MKITPAQLKMQDKVFWGKLIFILSTSPYFGKLRWVFKKELMETDWSINILMIDPKLIRIPESNDQLEISRGLIKDIFRLPPNYQRPQPLFESDTNYSPSLRFSRYHIGREVGTIPLTDSDIQTEDLKMFKNKLNLLIPSPFTKQIAELQTYYRSQLNQVKTQLTRWKQLINSRLSHPYG